MILSGALILVAVSAYDAVSGSAALYGSRRRRSHMPLPTPLDPMFAARLARYGVPECADPEAEIADAAPPFMTIDEENGAAAAPPPPPTPVSEEGLPTRQVPEAFVDVLADLDAFDRWLRDGRALTSPQGDGQARHLPPACALFAPEDETARTSPASPAQDLPGHPVPRRFAHLDAGDGADTAAWLR